MEFISCALWTNQTENLSCYPVDFGCFSPQPHFYMDLGSQVTKVMGERQSMPGAPAWIQDRNPRLFSKLFSSRGTWLKILWSFYSWLKSSQHPTDTVGPLEERPFIIHCSKRFPTSVAACSCTYICTLLSFGLRYIVENSFWSMDPNCTLLGLKRRGFRGSPCPSARRKRKAVV